MEITSHIDLTVPFWGLIVALAYACYFILKMQFQVSHLSKEFETLKNEFHELKSILLKNFTTEP